MYSTKYYYYTNEVGMAKTIFTKEQQIDRLLNKIEKLEHELFEQRIEAAVKEARYKQKHNDYLELMDEVTIAQDKLRECACDIPEIP
jgi:hypothetical protein